MEESDGEGSISSYVGIHMHKISNDKIKTEMNGLRQEAAGRGLSTW
jgi:hypothetical protein